MRIAIAFAALLCACAATPSAQPAPVTRVSYEISSWGYPQERWSVAANGEASFERTQPGAQFGSSMTAQSVTLTPADFERIRADLAPIERFAEHGLTCEVQMTDAPYGTVKWQRSDGGEQQVSFYTACRETHELTVFFEHLNAADDRFHTLTNTSDHFAR